MEIMPSKAQLKARAAFVKKYAKKKGSKAKAERMADRVSFAGKESEYSREWTERFKAKKKKGSKSTKAKKSKGSKSEMHGGYITRPDRKKIDAFMTNPKRYEPRLVSAIQN